jgi:hypothetical protein
MESNIYYIGKEVEKDKFLLVPSLVKNSLW